MRRVSWKALGIQCMVFVMVSVLLFAGIDSSLRDAERRDYEQKTIEVLKQISAGSRFEKVLPDSNLLHASFVTDMYVGYGREEEITGYVICISGEGVYKDASVWLSFSPDSAVLLHVSAHDADGVQRSRLESSFLKSLYNIPLPAALEEDVLMAVPVLLPVVPGLQDGEYKRTAEDAEEDGYVDFVEIVVEDGWITAVKWDGIHRNTHTGRAEDSLAKEEPGKEAVWARQAYAMEQKLEEIQDPFLIPVKSNGKTEMVSGVTIDVRMFIQLAALCIEDAKQTDSDDTASLSVPDVVVSAQGEQMVSVIAIGGKDSGILTMSGEQIRLYGFATDKIRTVVHGETELLDEERSLLLAVNRAYAFLQEYMK